jgi:translation elongation factor EF-4
MVIKERMFSKQFISIEESVQQKIVAKETVSNVSTRVFYKLFAPNFSQRKNAIEEASLDVPGLLALYFLF